MPDNNFQNQNQGQSQGQQGNLGDDAIDTGIDTENNGDMGTGNDVVGPDGRALNPDGSPKGTDLNGDEDLTSNIEAEDDPQANRNEQAAT